MMPSQTLRAPDRLRDVWILLFGTGKYEKDESFRSRLAQTATIGLQWTGLAGGLAVVLHLLTGVLTKGQIPWTPPPGPSLVPLPLSQAVLLGGLSLFLLVLSRRRTSLPVSRLAMAVVTLMVATVALYDDTLTGTYGPQYVIVLYLLATIAVPFQPWQILSLGGGLSVLFYAMAPEGLLWTGQLLSPTPVAAGLVLMAVVTVLLTGISALLYAHRWTLYRTQAQTEHHQREAPTEGQNKVEQARPIFQTIFDNLPVMIDFYDEEGELLMVNDYWEEVLGWTPEEIKQLSTPNETLYANPEERRQSEAFFEEAPDEWRDFKLCTKNGGVVDTTWTNVRLPDGRRIGIGVDISERKDYERALREERNRFATLFENLPTPVVHGKVREKTEGVVISNVNAAFEEVFGYDAERVQGESLLDLIVPPDQREEALEINQRALENGTLQKEVQRITEKGLRNFHLQAALRKQSGGPTETYAIYSDITERKRMEKKLRAREEWLRAITQNISDGIFRSTPEQGLVYANEAYMEMFGYDSLEELYQIDSTEMYANPEVREQLAQIEHEEGSLDGVEVEFQRKDGSTFIGLLSSTVVRDESGSPIYYDGAVTDITERKRRERQLEEAKEEAEEANRLKSAFLANMSHEIRTPLTSIIGFAEAIGDAFADADVSEGGNALDGSLEEAQQFAQLIERSGQRLLETLNSVLNLSKLESGAMQLDPEPVDAAREVNETAELFERRAAKQDISMETEVAESPLWTYADRGALERVLHNLLSNAVKFTEAGGSVVARARPAQDFVILEVEDTGMGIDPEFLPHLFEAFEQESKGPDRAHEGSGLGMAVTKKLVNRMDGTIDVESAPGEGTCFTVRLPLASSPE